MRASVLASASCLAACLAGSSSTVLAAKPIDPAQLPAAAKQRVDFARDVQPLVAGCVKCHGEKKQKSNYRLDRRAEALKGGDLGLAIVPGDSAGSPLIHYVSGLHAEVKMPPSGAMLSAAQVGLLRAWIDQGATWPKDTMAAERGVWWAFRPLQRPALPQLNATDAAWVRNPIDAFVVARLRARGLRPAGQADRRVLIRRLYFDLLGLPPTLEEVEAFVADRDPQAYEKLVDRLLDSPHYGERWARHWLDVVHYGESHGYDKDQPRPHAWPYRDYVIRAFNNDKRYDRFVQEQIAGDVLFPGTADGIEALGFIAAGPWDFIGHVEVPESKIDGKIARHLDRDDMVANTINTFSSVTVQCAQCHNHKFDPVTQEDYYRLQAVFAALDRADKSYDLDPATAQRRALLLARQRELDQKKKTIDDRLKKQGGPELAEFERRLRDAGRKEAGNARAEFGYHSGIEREAGRTKWVQLDLGRSVPIDKIVLTGAWDDFNQIGAGFGFPVRYKVEIADHPSFQTSVAVVADRTQVDQTNPGVTPQSIAAGGRSARYVRVTATKLAPRLNDYIFALAELSILDAEGRNVARSAAVTSFDSIEAVPRWSRKNLVDGIVPSPGSLTATQIEQLRKQRQALTDRLLDSASKTELAMLNRQLAETRQELGKLPLPKLVYAGTIHNGGGAFSGTGPMGGKPRSIRVLKRGDVKNPGKEVEPGALSVLSQLPGRFDLSAGQSEGERRAALARWLTDPRNPLTWRSIVNRVWLYHFGRGIVDTPNDFGRMGQLPTHPELLDWLALEFLAKGQSFKQLHRWMLTSATYRQASADTPEARAGDASNQFYGRMNRRKLSAEEIRDSILCVSGKLSPMLYGPSFKDFVIDKPEHSPHYLYDRHDPEDPASQRRSIYRFIVRSQQQPFLAVLDCADPSLAVDKRNQTITPLQALALLNNQLCVVMAKHFAERAARSSGDLRGQVQAAFRLALSRGPTPDELTKLTAFAKAHGLANTCRALFNLNEFVFVD